MKRKSFFILAIAFTAISFYGCKKLIDIDTPQNQLTTDKVFADTTSVIAAMVNVYALFDNTIDVNYNKYMGLYTDEFNFPTNPANAFYASNLPTANSTVLNIWKNNYFAIYSCNAILQQMQVTKSIPAALAKSIAAEAKFLRAYAYFYLVNSFGQVPLVLSTNVNETSTAVRADSATVYRQIISDLQDAQADLPLSYPGGEKVRATKWAAIALLARVYLFQQDWTIAESNAGSVINSGLFTPLDVPSNVFLANSQETILQFWTQYGYISDASSLIPGSGAPQYPVSTALLNAFEPGDLRKTAWLNSTTVNGNTYYYAYKYHNRNSTNSQPEYLMGLRLAEQYLIRAEARAQQGNLTGAIADINIIRERAGLADLPTALTQQETLDELSQEWRVEFFAEWGSRFLELKNTGRLGTVMSAYKPGWSPKSELLPVPQNEITYDPQLTQNPGY